MGKKKSRGRGKGKSPQQKKAEIKEKRERTRTYETSYDTATATTTVQVVTGKRKHVPKKARPEQIMNVARVYFGGTYYCVGDGKREEVHDSRVQEST